MMAETGTRPIPVPTSETQPFWDGCARAELLLQRCRQCGTVWHPGRNVGLGTDYTIYALIDGVVKFEHHNARRYKVSVYPKTKVATAAV